MITLKTAWAWFRDHAWLIVIVGLAILVWIATRGKKDVSKILSAEREVVKAKAEARKAEVQLGAEKAAEKIRTEHQETIKKLDEAQKKRAEELAKDPEALVEHLLRASR
jgi:flagellar biosynthesis/type III secretory pathway M-ring protein FliF/YscJ